MAHTTTRRTFLKSAAATTAAAVATGVHAAGSDTIQVGLVGCGSRGTDAAINALQADPNVKLVALCDVFADRLEAGLGKLAASKCGARVDVPVERRFTDFDGYKKVIDAGVDVVLLASPPAFRPVHLAYAVEKGKHIFMEKPHAVDAPGVRSVLESVKKAKEKSLCLVSGFCYRYDPFKRETLKRIHDGQIGEVLAVHTTYLTNGMANWHRGSDPKWSDMESQVRNWIFYTWLSGDILVEQAIHGVDKAAWVMNGAMPVAATGMGGRQVRTDRKYGNVYDHFSVVYEYEGGAKVFAQCRQMDGCFNNTDDHVFGTKGQAQVQRHTVTAGGTTWTPEGKHDFGRMYQVEHDELFAAVRAGKPINDGEAAVHSTLMAILGRQAAYTGQRVTWQQMLESQQSLVPNTLAWGTAPEAVVAMPGKTKFR